MTAAQGASAAVTDGELAPTNSEGEELGRFLSQRVTKGTRKGYAADWRAWTQFIEKRTTEQGLGDVYLDKIKSDTARAVILAMFFKERYEAKGMRGRQATAVGAGVKHHFTAALKSVDWFESHIVSSARSACRMTCDELRGHKKKARSLATLPISEDMLLAARVRLWEGKSWEWGDIDKRMTYVGLMWGFDQVARVSEYTSAEVLAEDHCVRLWQLTFIIEDEVGGAQRVISGASLSKEMETVPARRVVACEVEASSHKGGALSKKKLIGRRSHEEGQWLDDLVEWLSRSKVKAEDQIFTRYKSKAVGTKVYMKRLSAEMIRAAVKDMAKAAGLPTERFSSHSLRKGGMSQMRGLGASADDRRDRGNYVDGSNVFNTTYDFSTVALGPLACNANVGTGCTVKPMVEHVKRCLPIR